MLSMPRIVRPDSIRLADRKLVPPLNRPPADPLSETKNYRKSLTSEYRRQVGRGLTPRTSFRGKRVLLGRRTVRGDRIAERSQLPKVQPCPNKCAKMTPVRPPGQRGINLGSRMLRRSNANNMLIMRLSGAPRVKPGNNYLPGEEQQSS
jgi:hypothetical protein